MKEKFKRNIKKYDSLYEKDGNHLTRYGLQVVDLYELAEMQNKYDMVDQLFKLAFIQGVKYQKAKANRIN